MRIPTWPSGIVFLLAAAISSALGQPQSGDTVPSRTELAAKITAAWPESGAVEVTYVNQFGHWVRMGYEFASGQWYFARSELGDDYLKGRDSLGYYDSFPLGRPVVARTDWNESQASSLDSYLPQIGLCEILRDTKLTALIAAAPEGEGGFVVTVELPRGQRFPEAGELPDAEVEAWGKGGTVFRPAVYRLREDLSVASFTHPITEERQDPRTRTLKFGVSPDGPPGFQVNPEHGGRQLAECVLASSRSATGFGRASVLEAMTAARVEGSVERRNPVVTAEFADAHPESAPSPIRGRPRTDWTTAGALVGAGALAVLLGVGAWWRSRRA